MSSFDYSHPAGFKGSPFTKISEECGYPVLVRLMNDLPNWNSKTNFCDMPDTLMRERSVALQDAIAKDPAWRGIRTSLHLINMSADAQSSHTTPHHQIPFDVVKAKLPTNHFEKILKHGPSHIQQMHKIRMPDGTTRKVAFPVPPEPEWTANMDSINFYLVTHAVCLLEPRSQPMRDYWARWTQLPHMFVTRFPKDKLEIERLYEHEKRHLFQITASGYSLNLGPCSLDPYRIYVEVDADLCARQSIREVHGETESLMAHRHRQYLSVLKGTTVGLRAQIIHAIEEGRTPPSLKEAIEVNGLIQDTVSSAMLARQYTRLSCALTQARRKRNEKVMRNDDVDPIYLSDPIGFLGTLNLLLNKGTFDHHPAARATAHNVVLAADYFCPKAIGHVRKWLPTAKRRPRTLDN